MSETRWKGKHNLDTTTGRERIQTKTKRRGFIAPLLLWSYYSNKEIFWICNLTRAPALQNMPLKGCAVHVCGMSGMRKVHVELSVGSHIVVHPTDQSNFLICTCRTVPTYCGFWQYLRIVVYDNVHVRIVKYLVGWLHHDSFFNDRVCIINKPWQIMLKNQATVPTLPTTRILTL